MATTNQILAKKYNLLPFEGEWRASFGEPEPRGVWTIQGASGSGKTTFALMLAKYLVEHTRKRVIYWSIEQLGDIGFQQAIQRIGMPTAGITFEGNDPTAMERVIKLMTKPHGHYDVLIIDSLTALHYNQPQGFLQRHFIALSTQLKNRLIIFVCHEKQGSGGVIETPAGNYIKQQAQIKITVVGFVCYVNARAGFGQYGGENFIVNQKKADEYALQNI